MRVKQRVNLNHKDVDFWTRHEDNFSYDYRGLLEHYWFADQYSEDTCFNSIDESRGTTWRYWYNPMNEREQKRLYNSGAGDSKGGTYPWVYYLLGGNNEQYAVYHGAQLSDEVIRGTLTGSLPFTPCDITNPYDRTVFMYPAEYNTYGTGSSPNLTWKTDGEGVWREEYKIYDHLGSLRTVLREDEGSYEVISELDYRPFGGVLASSGDESRTDFIGKEQDNESLLGDFGVRKYDNELGRFTTTEPLLEEYYSWTPYHYCMNNPMNLKDNNGLDAVKIIDEGTKTVTIKAVYVVGNVLNDPTDPSRKLSYTDSEIKSMQTDINKALNDEKYTVSDGTYKGYNVKFDLIFVPKVVGSTFDVPENYTEDGVPIGNSFDISDKNASPITLKGRTVIKNGKFKVQPKGGAVVNHKHLVMNSKYDNLLHRIHEIFHTFFFNNDNAKSGIGSYDNMSMPNQDDINEMVNNTRLPAR